MAVASLPIFMRVGQGDEFEVGRVEFTADEQLAIQADSAQLHTAIAAVLRKVADELDKPPAVPDGV